MKNKKILSLVAVGVLAGFVWIGSALAETATSPSQSLAEKLAAKFNLNKDEVGTFLDQTHEERRVQMQKDRQTMMSQGLDKAVADGVITAEQKQKILDKHTEMQQKREQERADMEKWATDNGIDFSKLSGYGVGFGGRGMGMRGGHGGFGMMR